MPHLSAPILVLDSGLGGLTVVKALHARLAHEEIIYFGDTARMPYGPKSKATVTSFVGQIISHLLPTNPRHVVIACNTATALSLPTIKLQFPDLAITGVIEPGARAAVDAAGNNPSPLIAVIATEATIRSKAYEYAIQRHCSQARLILHPTPLLAPIIEDGRDENDPLVHLALQQYLQPLIDCHPDVLVLGCTHYPILKNLISRMMGERCRVIDSAQQCAEDVARRLPTFGGGPAGPVFSSRALHCYVTDDSPKFQFLAERFLGVPVEPPTWISPQRLMAQALPAPIRQAG